MFNTTKLKHSHQLKFTFLMIDFKNELQNAQKQHIKESFINRLFIFAAH